MSDDLLPARQVEHVEGEVMGGPVEIIGPVNETTARGDQILVKQNGDYFVVSSVVVPYSGSETLIFRSDEHGVITEWGEVGGGRGMSREAAIAQLELTGPYDYS